MTDSRAPTPSGELSARQIATSPPYPRRHDGRGPSTAPASARALAGRPRRAGGGAASPPTTHRWSDRRPCRRSRARRPTPNGQRRTPSPCRSSWSPC